MLSRAHFIVGLGVLLSGMSIILTYTISMPQPLMLLLFGSTIITSLVGLMMSLRDLLRWWGK